MKILHLMLACFYIDNYSYQENLLPKYHHLMGHDVRICASLFTFDENGDGRWISRGSKYINENGIPVTRLEFKKGRLNKALRKYVGLAQELVEFKPDIIFVHGLQFWDIKVVANYAKSNPKTVIYVDNHADFSNSAKSWASKRIQHEILWRRCAQIINPYTKKFYGVLPARVDFLVNEYKLPKEKVELLVMGADDERVKEAGEQSVRSRIREQLGLKEDDFVIMTGGKIDAFKTQTLLLMEAVKKIKDPQVHLVVFGSVTNELKEKVEALAKENNIHYIGWIKSIESYDYFAASDLVVFPGRHSVFWEQVAAQGIPMICKKWEGTTHIDVGGNVVFLEQDTVEEIEKAIDYVRNPVNYKKMKKVAEEQGKKTFLYSKIAERSIC